MSGNKRSVKIARSNMRNARPSGINLSNSNSPPSLNNTGRAMSTGRLRSVNTLLQQIEDSQNNFAKHLSETQNMMFAEAEQCHLGDRFWGLDRDLADRLSENTSMGIEDSISRELENLHLTVAKHKQWNAELEMQTFYASRSTAQSTKNPAAAQRSMVSSRSESSALNQSYNPNQSTTTLSNQMSVHLDGLQQSKAIVKEAGEAFVNTLKRMNMSSIATAMNGSAMDSNNPVGSADNEKVKKKQLYDQMQEQLAFSAQIESRVPKHIPTLDGHPDHYWDQELLLQLAFAQLDVGRKGGITMDEIGQISNSDEHDALCTHAHTVTAHHNDSTSNATARAKVYLQRSSFERECHMSRQIVPGNTVWGLHSCGVVWLPAVVERIYPAPDSITSNNGGEYVCDLRYPLAQRDLLKLRSMNATRDLVQLPSSQHNISNSNFNMEGVEEPMLTYPNPFPSERAACGYAFDLVDSEALGVVELNTLVRSFCQQKEFQKIVEGTSALSIIFAEASELDTITEDMLKKKMGVFYLLTPWRREQVKRHMKIAAAVEQEMDAIQVPTRGDYGKDGNDGNDYLYEFA
eukprot:gene30987-40317_t